jgi:hypothetical protein
MQRQHNCVLALGIVAILAATLALQHRSGDGTVGSASSASAPSTPGASFESAHDAQLQQSHSGGCGDGLASANLPSKSLAACAGQQAHQLAIAREPLYGSLFRRPPPSLS